MPVIGDTSTSISTKLIMAVVETNDEVTIANVRLQTQDALQAVTVVKQALENVRNSVSNQLSKLAWIYINLKETENSSNKIINTPEKLAAKNIATRFPSWLKTVKLIQESNTNSNILNLNKQLQVCFDKKSECAKAYKSLNILDTDLSDMNKDLSSQLSSVKKRLVDAKILKGRVDRMSTQLHHDINRYANTIQELRRPETILDPKSLYSGQSAKQKSFDKHFDLKNKNKEPEKSVSQVITNLKNDLMVAKAKFSYLNYTHQELKKNKNLLNHEVKAMKSLLDDVRTENESLKLALYQPLTEDERKDLPVTINNVNSFYRALQSKNGSLNSAVISYMKSAGKREAARKELGAANSLETRKGHQCNSTIDKTSISSKKDSVAERKSVIQINPGFIQNSANKSKIRKNQKANFYSCPICGRRFAKTSGVSRHKKIHLSEGEKPYRCSLCNKGHLRKIHLKQHMLSKHQI